MLALDDDDRVDFMNLDCDEQHCFINELIEQSRDRLFFVTGKYHLTSFEIRQLMILVWTVMRFDDNFAHEVLRKYKVLVEEVIADPTVVDDQ